MNARPIIAVDAMGGDFGPSVVVPGAIDAARLHDLHVLLVGDTPKVEAELAKLDLANVHFDIVQADDVVHMNEKPSDILRRKKNASIQVACRLVKDGKADAVVSAGHSGATVACAKRKGQKIIRHIAEFDTWQDNYLDHPEIPQIPHPRHVILFSPRGLLRQILQFHLFLKNF